VESTWKEWTKMDRERDLGYTPPALEVLGSVHELTLLQDKIFGPTDGFTFNGIPITDNPGPVTASV
jgi:hypothetical protein